MIRMFLASLVFASVAYAAPPEVPKEIKARPGQLVRVVAKGDGEIGIARSFGDDAAFFDELALKPNQRRYVFQSDIPGTYFLSFWAKGELEGAVCIITVGDGKPPAPVKPVDPVDPPVTPPTAYYFLIVRPDGPAAPEFAKAMALPAWAELKKAGHSYKDKTLTAAVNDIGLSLPPGTQLPTVVTLATAGNASKIVRGPVPLPTDSAGILDLPKGVAK